VVAISMAAAAAVIDDAVLRVLGHAESGQVLPMA